ncbi:SusE domain-containing protein [Pedobacter cryoconitis]|uniref:SusE-like outer membrane protein n=1 Tax=Pedobacter cryoconitis TaxID=188932 RepID=A0A327SNG4_9SPHI|nr:SusE domain-containing protein [Pedobacter cryoconitis]RAJ30499.1 SusE-like outer membrane protein [Pedobacter cryoconitis]
MKSLFIKSMTYSLFLLLFVSCKKDETKIVAGNGTAPVLTATQSTLVLDSANAKKTAVVFNWTASSFNYNAGISYAIQLDVAGNNFSGPKEVALNTALTKTFTVEEINSLINQLGLTPGTPGKIEVRAKASIGDAFSPAYSNVMALTVTPYQIIIDYPSLYVPGSYQGWDFKTAAKISSVNDNKVYEGYINFPDASTDFKFTSQANWNGINYGTSSPGTLNAGGGDNLHTDGAGYYLVKADTKALTYSLTKTVWAVIGTATGSTAAETPMTYDVASKVWTVTKSLAAGSFKFRANGTDAINFGDSKPASGKPVYGGADIPVAAAGNYKIILNLGTPGNYTYSVIKQ